MSSARCSKATGSDPCEPTHCSSGWLVVQRRYASVTWAPRRSERYTSALRPLLKSYKIVAKLSTIVVTLFCTAAALMTTAVGCSSPGDNRTDTPRIAGAGTHVTMQYTIRLDDGTEVASNVGASPLSFTIGQNEVFPAVEAALEGLTVGDERSVPLTAEQAYGPRDESAVREVELALVPEESRLIGSVLMAEDGAGGQREVTIRELRDKTVVLDLNHPLAGEALSVDIRVVSVRLPQDSD